ncbi:twin-arginine translocation signal domain-containing protein [Roseiflexus sp.]
MTNTPSQTRLTRRNFLRLTAAVGVTAGGGYALAEYAP